MLNFAVRMETEFKRHLTEADAAKRHALVDGARHVVVVGHANPDGDAVGAVLAMTLYLRSLGKDVRALIPNRQPDFLNWLPGASELINAEYQRPLAVGLLTGADLVMCLDFSSPSRTESLADLLMSVTAPVILIDHHLEPAPMPYALTLSDPSASATCQIIFCLLRELGYYPSMPLSVAECLYCGIMTDTGALTYNSSDPGLFLIVSALLLKGVDKDRIYRSVYHSYSIDRLRLVGHVLADNLIYDPILHAAHFTLSRKEMLRFNFKKGDAEGLVNLPLQLKGCVLSVSMREDTRLPDIHISLRSVGSFSCQPMAARFFGGGGHANASGGRLRGATLSEAREVLREALKAYAPLLSRARP